MNEALRKSSPATYAGIHNATCLQESGDSHSLYNSHVGQQIDLFGQQVSHANPTALQENDLEYQTKDTFYQSELNSLELADHHECSESKFPTWNGSMPRGMQWKERVTPSGRRFVEQIPLAPFKSADGSTGQLLPTPMASDNRNRGSINKTPSVTRRMNSGKQIGLSMLFDGRPCPFCVAGIMGYPAEWVSCAAKALATPSCRR